MRSRREDCAYWCEVVGLMQRCQWLEPRQDFQHIAVKAYGGGEGHAPMNDAVPDAHDLRSGSQPRSDLEYFPCCRVVIAFSFRPSALDQSFALCILHVQPRADADALDLAPEKDVRMVRSR